MHRIAAVQKFHSSPNQIGVFHIKHGIDYQGISRHVVQTFTRTKQTHLGKVPSLINGLHDCKLVGPLG